MKTLTDEETRVILAETGLDAPSNAAFALRKVTEPVAYGWHEHPYHQIIYARKGTTQVEGRDGVHLLPAGHAVWISAHVPHRTMIRDLDGVSLFFRVSQGNEKSGRIEIFPVTPVLREMVFYALRWPGGEREECPIAAVFFRTFLLLVREQCDAVRAGNFVLPRARHSGLVRAMDAARADPGSVGLDAVLRVAGMSERSFRRHFREETGMSWQHWITQARFFHAAILLGQGERVTYVAAEAGYASMSAFAKSFTRVIGLAPLQYQKRSRGMDEEPPPGGGEAF